MLGTEERVAALAAIQCGMATLLIVARHCETGHELPGFDIEVPIQALETLVDQKFCTVDPKTLAPILTPEGRAAALAIAYALAPDGSPADHAMRAAEAAGDALDRIVRR